MEQGSMRKRVKSIITTILNARFSALFFTIVLLFLLRPFLEAATALNVLTGIFLWLILISCVWAVHDKKKHQGIALGMAILVILADFLDMLLQTAATSLASNVAAALFVGYAVVAVFSYLARQEEVTADMIMAAASEYVLIGILFGLLYHLVDMAYPGSFSFSGLEAIRSWFLYFSFVTLTTTGYGDVIPVSSQARSLATLEAITGQLYIAIAVARLVGLYTVRKKKH
jgi:hypothetical protein